MTKENLKTVICQIIDQHRKQIIDIGESIMDQPELGFKEFKTAEKIKKCFTDLNLDCTDKLAITGVKAVIKGATPGPTLCFMGELDGLIVSDHPRCDPDTGAAHACGHNAQIAVLRGAAIALTKSNAAQHLAGNIVLFAVPAEEYVEIDYRMALVRDGKLTFPGGKCELIELGQFDDIDMAVMIHTAHPKPDEGQFGVPVSNNGFIAKTIRFLGKASHAGGGPEHGINALYAANLTLAAINAQRETFRDQDHVRVHPIITKGGDTVNIIPAVVTMETMIRAKTHQAVIDAAMKVDRAARGAAMAMGAKVEIETIPGYMPLNNNPKLATIFKNNAGQIFGDDQYHDCPHRGGSTDAGDLSQIMPLLHPYMAGATGIAHGIDWHILDPDAGYIAPAKTLAMMAVDLLADDAAAAKDVLATFKPTMTSEQYLQQQKAIFRKETYDSANDG